MCCRPLQWRCTPVMRTAARCMLRSSTPPGSRSSSQTLTPSFPASTQYPSQVRLSSSLSERLLRFCKRFTYAALLVLWTHLTWSQRVDRASAI